VVVAFVEAVASPGFIVVVTNTVTARPPVPALEQAVDEVAITWPASAPLSPSGVTTSPSARTVLAKAKSTTSNKDKENEARNAVRVCEWCGMGYVEISDPLWDLLC
jgi:hypothetical protein